MTVEPWLIWYPALALINLFVFLAVRNRWGRSVLPLALAAIGGVAIGDRLGGGIGIEPLRIGDMHVVTASAAAQLLMLAVTLLAALGPIRVEEPEAGAGGPHDASPDG
jgi:hypothetical protein